MELLYFILVFIPLIIVYQKNYQIDDIATHRGRKKRITENFDEQTAIYFTEILTYSLSIRYNELTKEEIIENMKKALMNLINHLSIICDFPVEIKEEIISSLK